MDYPERYRLRRIEGKWYLETTRTLEHEPRQFRGFIPLAQARGAGLMDAADGAVLESQGRSFAGGDTYLYSYASKSPELTVSVLGNVKPVERLAEERSVPAPTIKQNVRWHRGHWQREVKSGWKDIPYEWLDAPQSAAPVSKKGKARKSRKATARAAPKSKRVVLGGSKVELDPGFRLAPSSVRKCFGPRALRGVIEDALSVPVSSVKLQDIAQDIAKLSDRGTATEQEVIDTVARVLGDRVEWSLDFAMLEQRGIIETSEDEKTIRFLCPDRIPVPETAPSTGRLEDALAWSVARAGLDPSTAPVVMQGLREAPRNQLGEIHNDELEKVLAPLIVATHTFRPVDWFHELTFALEDSGVILAGVTGGREKRWLGYWLVPPDHVSRDPASLAQFLVDVKREWERTGDLRQHIPQRWTAEAYGRAALEEAGKTQDAAFVASIEQAVAPRLMIQERGALDLLKGLEGHPWADKQRAGGLNDPRGFDANLAAFKILREMGERAAGLIVSDIVPGAGLLAGDEGRAYSLMPDGEIMLLGESATEAFSRDARRILRVA